MNASAIFTIHLIYTHRTPVSIRMLYSESSSITTLPSWSISMLPLSCPGLRPLSPSYLSVHPLFFLSFYFRSKSTYIFISSSSFHFPFYANVIFLFSFLVNPFNFPTVAFVMTSLEIFSLEKKAGQAPSFDLLLSFPKASYT
jgi:hypothetical protein